MRNVGMLYSQNRKDETGNNLPVSQEELLEVAAEYEKQAPSGLLNCPENVDAICQHLAVAGGIWSVANIEAAVFNLNREGKLKWAPKPTNLAPPTAETIRPPDPPKPDFRTAAEKLNALGLQATSLVNHADVTPHKEKSNMAKAMFDDIKKKSRAAEMRLKLGDAQTLTIQGPGGRINWAATNDARRAAIQQVEHDYSDVQ